jgi:hypothetical protein
MDRKCHWCTRPADGTISIRVTDDPGDDLSYACSPGCEQKLRDYFHMCRRRLKWMILGYVLLTPLTVFFLLIYKVPHFGESFAVFVAFSAMGLLAMRYPIVTQNTIESMGVLRALSFIRFTGTVLIAMGVLSLFTLNNAPLASIVAYLIGTVSIVAYYVHLLRQKEYPDP